MNYSVLLHQYGLVYLPVSVKETEEVKNVKMAPAAVILSRTACVDMCRPNKY